MNPFTTFEIAPAYGVYETAISWSLAAGVTGNVFFYRSETGVPGSWELLNPATPATGAEGTYLDTTPAPRMLVPVFYRGLVDPGGAPETWLKGPAVTSYDSYSRREYLLAREVLRREYRMMATHNGLPIFHYATKWRGTAATGVDAETHQLLGPDCAQDPSSGFGGLWVGRYHPPVQSWCMVVNMMDEDQKIRPEAAGEDPEASIGLRLLAFPKPGREHLIVFPRSDRRYVITDPIRRFHLRGNLPLLWECNALLLDRDDARYRIRIPELLPDPISA